MPEAPLELLDGAPLRTLISRPAAAAPAPHGSARWPVLCFLHGYDEGAPMEIRQALTLHGPLRPGNAGRPRERFLIVAPQLPLRGDVWHRHAGDVHAIVDAARTRHHGDPQRTYLTGFSFGGNGVFDLALRRPVFWAALWPVDPTRVPARDPVLPVWLSIGGVARHASDRFVRALSLEPAGSARHGDRVYLDEGADHVGSARRAYGDARIYDWLLTHRAAQQLP